VTCENSEEENFRAHNKFSHQDVKQALWQRMNSTEISWLKGDKYHTKWRASVKAMQNKAASYILVLIHT